MTPFRFPRYWWGQTGNGLVAPTFSVLHLIQAGVLDGRTAALLWALLARRTSIITVGGWARGTGKTTTLTALAGFFPADTELVVTRGVREDFSFLSQTAGDRTYLMVGEFSDHTPGYLWGPAAARLVKLTDKEYRFAGTMHAEGPEDLVRQWEAIGVAPADLPRHLQLAVYQAAFPAGGALVRKVTGIHWFYPAPRGPGGIGAKSLVSWSPAGDQWTPFSSPDTWAGLARWAGTSPEALEAEIGRRERYLQLLAAEGPPGFDQARQRLLEFAP